ncbi:FtsX-like permease family protein [Aridibaculum aurantiacum]|uniref:FtsX-like permease family protein n=1 Tax=Aridibaculum aurantiacum TaxID=2810307 RepID=UPI001A967517|nr:FtsX-like permease family protein [Aridibaculum aurantiacum]
MFHQLLKKIIRSGIGKSRRLMAATGLSIAMLLIFSAVQVQVNYNELLHGESNQDSIANFLVINKKIDGNSSDNTLSAQQVAELQQQPFIEEVGQLTASRFKVTAQSPSDNFPFYTDLFFESVPNKFIDVQSTDWKWEEGSQVIPMIIPNQFLDLYNFGFAPSQNLIQLTQGMVMSIPIIINIHGSGQVVQFTGRVVGFSDRISSVLVPDNFLKWANQRFSVGAESRPSRVVIKTNDPGDPQLVEYLQEKGLVTDADKTRFSKYRQVVNTVVNASWVTGATMLLFALLVFSLFIQLTIASTKTEINLLITLGTSPKQLQRFLLRQFMPFNIIITLICLLVVAVLQWWLQRFLQQQNMNISPWISYYTVLTAALILLVLWLVNTRTIYKYIKQAEE